jgi:hypothetical protein
MATSCIPSGAVLIALPSAILVGVLALIAAEAVWIAPPAEPTAAWAESPEVGSALETVAPAPLHPEFDDPPDTVAAAESPTIANAAESSNLSSPADVTASLTVPPESAARPVEAPPAVNGPAGKWTPEELQASLLRVPEISLQHPADRKVAPTGRAKRTYQPLLAVIDARPDLQGLPVRRGPNVQLSPADADAFRDASVLLRKAMSELAGKDGQPNRRLQIRPEVIAARPEMVARMLLQMLQTESPPLRKVLIARLSSIRGPAATRALVHRAVYEPMAELRRSAVRALGRRPVDEYLPPLLDALASPWPPAADQAAEALAVLAPAEAVPELVHRLDDPGAGAGEELPSVQELVRVNHARNCLLCHPQSVSPGDGIRVAVPSPVRPLPSPFSLAAYEGGGRGGSSVPRGTVFARPDATYLRPDFSWMLPVESPGPWPGLQRYDFLVRTRPAVSGELAPLGSDSPQRQAVVRALRALTGKDFGNQAADWRTGLASAKPSD